MIIIARSDMLTLGIIPCLPPGQCSYFTDGQLEREPKETSSFCRAIIFSQKAEASLAQIAANPPIITALLNKLSLPTYPREMGLKLMKCGRCFEVYLRASFFFSKGQCQFLLHFKHKVNH